MYRLSENDLITLNKGICSVFHQEYNVLNFNALSACLNAYDSYYEDDNHIASAIFRAIITNHAFKDANKRTAFLALQFINFSNIGRFKIAELAIEIAKNTSMEVDDICNILYPESIKESYKPTYTFSYKGPVYRFERVYTVLKDPIYTTVSTAKQAANMIKGKLKNKFGFDYKAKLDIDEDNIMLVDVPDNEYQIFNNKNKNKQETEYDDLDLVGTLGGKDIYYINGKYIVDDMEFVSIGEIEDYLEA